MHAEPTKADLDRHLSEISHAARHEARSEKARINADYASRGLGMSGALISAAAHSFDKIHKNSLDRATQTMGDFCSRMRLQPGTIVSMARGHLENMGSAILGELPTAGLQAVGQQISQQYEAIFRQRLRGTLRDFEIGFLHGRSLLTPMPEQTISPDTQNSDAKLRGLLLRHLYGLRHSNGGNVPVNDIIFSGVPGVTNQVMEGICRQLADIGLIEWRPYLSDVVVGNARITALGVSAIERNAFEGFDLAFEAKGEVSQQRSGGQAMANSNKKIFIVHGHDEAALLKLARFLEKLDLEPIILNEKPSQGQTIIEKFERHAAEVGFAVVLLTPDDVGKAASENDEHWRGRQNVIFELGYFAAKLSRGGVCFMRKGNVEIPSDLYGVVYVEMDAGTGWQTELMRELRAAGIKFDANRAVS